MKYEKPLWIAVWLSSLTVMSSTALAGLFPNSWVWHSLGMDVSVGSTISPATLIPLGALIAGIGITVAATWRVAVWATEQASMRGELRALQDRIAKLEERLDSRERRVAK